MRIMLTSRILPATALKPSSYTETARVQSCNLEGYPMLWYFVLFLLTGSALAAEQSLVLVDAPFLMVDQ